MPTSVAVSNWLVSNKSSVGLTSASAWIPGPPENVSGLRGRLGSSSFNSFTVGGTSILPLSDKPKKKNVLIQHFILYHYIFQKYKIYQ